MARAEVEVETMNTRRVLPSLRDQNGFSDSFIRDTQADQLTQEQIEEFKEAFALFDKDGDGTITLHELDSVMRGLGQNPTREELTQMIAEVDSDGNGSIEFSEFLILIASRLKMEDMREEIRDAFGVFDKNNDGRLSTSELKDVLSSVGEKMSSDDINEMVAAADSRGTGMIDIDEFSTLMMSGT
ncbi:hypothetical protein CAPTEDRAFT_169155 [Capitella teleta]|uniref:EF-hand domain-containing protein n=1 Tax=Capitella teleta TaxID=283909 RepID=R7VDG5_CAPTE|nr:hypothetical protein CAPTEDRAFT_169155 [Capitella teleta]|eukprot:ELU13700.1 hypothetical protein CAPTEDRAFT_169155 [Capitella teleta]